MPPNPPKGGQKQREEHGLGAKGKMKLSVLEAKTKMGKGGQ
jgi:hypothetical protein